ncbi:uncharacterized protein TNCV_2032251 [Trichonephila clavipes]|nr:uncharacterized protein TNCV_2032251 [Trichonephila clavipes]
MSRVRALIPLKTYHAEGIMHVIFVESFLARCGNLERSCRLLCRPSHCPNNEFTCRNCGGGDRGRVAIYRPFGELRRAKIVLSPVWCSRPTTGVPRGPRSDYVRQSRKKQNWAVGSLVVRASDSRPEGLGSMLDVTKYPPSAHGFTCRNCGGGDRGRVAIYRPFGEVSLNLNRTVTCMVLKANDRRTSCPLHDEFRGPRSDYVRQVALATTTKQNWSDASQVSKSGLQG